MRRLAPIALLLAACAPALPAPIAMPAPPPIAKPAEAPPPPANVRSTAVDAPPPPSFPDGWMRAAAASPLDPPPKTAPKSLARLAENSKKPRVAFVPRVIRLADLPRVEVEPEPEWKKPPKVLPPAQRLDDVYTRGGSLYFRGKAFGVISTEYTETGARHAAWSTLSPRSDGDIQYRGAIAWVDRDVTRVHLVARVEAPARDIAGGIAYAFRSSCPRCTGTRDWLHVFMPNQGWGNEAFSHIALALAPCVGDSRTFRFSDTSIQAFRESGARPTRTTQTRLGLEVTQLTGDAEPMLIVYVADAVPGSD